MGRELRRVPLDFDWPLHKVWDGFINPHYKSCPEAAKGNCYAGSTAAGKWLEKWLRILMLACDDAANPNRRGIYPHPYLTELANAGYLPKGAPPRQLAELAAGLAGEPGILGYSSSHIWSAQKKIEEAAGLPDKWTWCPVCNGSGMDPAVKDAYESWEPEPPPEGPGYQVWETVSEGSPVSPVFETAEALIEWLVGEGYSREAAQGFVKTGWACSTLIAGGKLYKNIEMCAPGVLQGEEG
jgi:hypothetical protein